MDHLLLPDGAQHFIIAPYAAPKDQWYEHDNVFGNFIDYPGRKLWSEDDLHGKNRFSGRPDQSVEQFFQTWLFFGFAIEFFRLGDIDDVLTGEFLVSRGNARVQAVSTMVLLERLQIWVERVKDKRERVWNEYVPMFEIVREVLNRFCTPDEADRLLTEKRPTWPVRDEISTTMIALLFTLTMTAARACDKMKELAEIEWPTARSRILAKRLERMWCRADAATFLADLQIDGQYYFAASQSPRPDDLAQHYDCTKERCFFNVDDKFYETKHAGAPCSRESPGGGKMGFCLLAEQKEWVDAVCQTIDDDEDAFPIARWDRQSGKLRAMKYNFREGPKPEYVAISHVWTDGMGNPTGNALPECQLDRIQDLIERLRIGDGRRISPFAGPRLTCFWMDTLCIPHGDKTLKHKAINNMHHVYTSAFLVLVLDEWLLQIPSSPPVLDILTRLYQSNWVKRLWTHQEGFLPNSVCIQFSDRAVDLGYLLAKDTTLQHDFGRHAIYLNFPYATQEILLQQYTVIKKEIMINLKNGEVWKTYPRLARAMAGRRTTRATDETICLATILRFDVDAYQNFKGNSEEERAQHMMIKFLKELKRFPMGIIFNNYERLGISGWRWAPRSLLHHRNASLGYKHHPVERERDTSRVGGLEGFPVEYPGSLVKFGSVMQGLRSLERAFAIQADGSWPIAHQYVRIELPANDDARWMARIKYDTVLGVILSEIPGEEERTYMCVVGKSTEKQTDDIKLFEHYSIAKARVLADPPPRIDIVKAPLLSQQTKWFVR